MIEHVAPEAQGLKDKLRHQPYRASGVGPSRLFGRRSGLGCRPHPRGWSLGVRLRPERIELPPAPCGLAPT